MTASLILVCDAIGSRHQFGPEGGAFGRSRKCDWVLPDQDRHLSSVHARVLYQNDTFILVDESTNGTFLEGQSAAIGRGKAVSLSTGMKLMAGPYQIRVESVESSQVTSTNPFGASQTGNPARTSGMATPLRIDTSGASLPQNTSLDPLDHLGGAPETLTPVATAQTPQTVIPEPVSFSAPAGPVSPHETTRYQVGPATSQPSGTQPQMPTEQQTLVAPALQGSVMPTAVAAQTASPTQQAAPQTPVAAPTAAVATAAPPATSASAASSNAGNVIPEDFLVGLGAPPATEQPTTSAAQTPGLPDLSALMPSAPAESGQTASSTPATTIPDNIDFGLGSTAPTGSPATMPNTPQAPTAAPGMVPSPSTSPVSNPAVPPVGGQTGLPTGAPTGTQAGAQAISPADVPMPQPASPAPSSSSAALNPLDALKKRRAQREAELAQKAKSRADTSLAGKKSPPVASAAKSATPGLPQTPPVVLPNMPATPSVALPQATTTASAPPPSAKSAPTGSPTASQAASPTAAPAASGTGTPQISPEVFQALLAGLGFADAEVAPEEQAEIAKASGEMVQELANGLIALLKARKKLKTEFRMYETRIQPEENNPFKHFNVGELAIDEMLFSRKGGFLPPPEAAKEAFKDLQSHTMLTVAATQRAMRLLFESLSPETLAGEEDDGGLRLRGLGSKRGKFEAAKERHDRLRADFDAVVRQTIAEAFVQVEEEQARQQSKSYWENRKK